jgi:hypothetical protein
VKTQSLSQNSNKFRDEVFKYPELQFIQSSSLFRAPVYSELQFIQSSSLFRVPVYPELQFIQTLFQQLYSRDEKKKSYEINNGHFKPIFSVKFYITIEMQTTTSIKIDNFGLTLSIEAAVLNKLRRKSNRKSYQKIFPYEKVVKKI